MNISVANNSDNSDFLSHFQIITDLLPQSILLVDATGKIIFVNKSACEFLCYSLSELLGKHLQNIAIIPEDILYVYLKNWSVSRTLLPAKVELKIKEKGIISCRLDAGVAEPAKNSQPAKIIISLNEQNTHTVKFELLNKQLEIKSLNNEVAQRDVSIKQYEAKLKLALESARMGLWEYNPITKVFLRTKEYDKIFFGHSEESLDYKLETFLESVHPDDYHIVNNIFNNYKENKFCIEFRIFWPDNSIHWILSQGEIYKDKKAHIISLAGAIIDITPMKIIESKLIAAIQARDDFLALASHELSTPLTTLKLASQIRKRQIQSGDYSLCEPSHVIKILNEDAKQIDRLQRLINSMLDVKYITEGKLQLKKEIIDLTKVMNEIIERLNPQIVSSNSEVIFEAKYSILGCWDRCKIEQVFTNLLTNAVKYGSGKPIIVNVTKTETVAEIIVKDKGIGISSQDYERIFQPFERAVATNNISGLGIGLYIVKQYVEAHGGYVQIESQLNRGTVIIVNLPLNNNQIECIGII